MVSLIELSSYSLALPLLPAIVRYKHYPKELRFVCWYVFIGVFTEVISDILWTYRISNLFMLHLYVPASFTALFFFYKTLLHTLVKKYIWYSIAAVFYGFTVINSIWIQDIHTFNSYAINLEDTIIIVLAILSFYKISTELKVPHLENYPVFWINTGLLFYYSGSLLVFTLSNETSSFSKMIRTYLWSIHALFNVLMYVLMTIGLWVYRKNRKSTTLSL